MELQQIHQERWSGETRERGQRASSEEAAREFAVDQQTNGPNDCGSSEAALKAARARQRAVPQQWQPQLHQHMRIRPRRTSVGSAHLEHLPLPTDPESPVKGHEQWSKARTRASVWTNLRKPRECAGPREPTNQVTRGSSPWKSRSQVSVAELQLASGTSAQLQEDLQNLRQQVQKELKDMQDYMEQLHQQLNDATAVPERVRDEVGQHDRQVSNQLVDKVELREGAEAPDHMKDHRDAGEDWSESLSALKAQVKDLRRSDAKITADLEGLRKRFEEASANRGASATLEEIKVETQRMLQEYHSILNEEERIDWALESLGSSIVVSETVSSLAHSTLSWGSKVSSYLEELVQHDHQAGVAGGAGRVVKKPNIVLQPDTHPGNCYPFYGEKGNVTIMLPTAIFVTSVAVDGVSSKHFTASTPRKFTLWGYEDPRATPAPQETVLKSSDPSKPDRRNRKCRGKPCNPTSAKVEPTQQFVDHSGESWWESARRVLQWMASMLKSPARVQPEWDSRLSARQFRKVHLGDFELRKPQKLSVFDLQKKHEAPVRKVTFEFLSNFGHPYTCIYRLRVHGDKGKMSTSPLPVVEKE